MPIEPRPASRPIVSRYGVRYGKNHTLYQADFARWLTSIDDATEWPAIDRALVSVELEFVATKTKATRLTTPRFDIDNATKLNLDCWTSSGRLWVDDTQVIHLVASKRFTNPGEAPGTAFSVWPAASS